ncbi:MAG: hypothetical protein R6X02_32370 [Enhygromyxa sp.]
MNPQAAIDTARDAWTKEPADAAVVDVLERNDGIVMLSPAEHPTCGPLDLGRWPLVLVA